MANISVLNTSNQLSGKTITTAEGDYTISGAWTFSGNQVFTGNVQIGNAVGDTLTVTGTIVSNLLFTDATYDIGASGATRPRDLFLSRNAVVGGTLGVTGVATFTAVPVFSAGIGSAGVYPLNSVGGRLTLTSGTPVTTTDVTAATTLYFTPYNGNQIPLYDGASTWTPRSFTEISVAVPATTSTMYDVWVYDNSGTAALELTAWTNDTTRATALTTQNGVLVKTGATTRRYVGSFRTTSSSGQTEDSAARRLVWNHYNRVDRLLQKFESTDSWTYTTATVRQANGSTANQVDAVVGVAEALLELQLFASSQNTNADATRTAGIGVGSITAFTTSRMLQSLGPNVIPASVRLQHLSSVKLHPAVGYQYYAWLEYSQALGTTTWYGDNGDNTIVQNGLHGLIQG